MVMRGMDDRSSERRDYGDRCKRYNCSSERSDYRGNNRGERQRHRDDGKEQCYDYDGEYGRKRSRYESSKRGPEKLAMEEEMENLRKEQAKAERENKLKREKRVRQQQRVSTPGLRQVTSTYLRPKKLGL
ncbi:uncharacterized protein LOC125421765 [Ziziphus jujuba]|uniref:Uncharacterized protein LOC125421765 n=1 Tax=Ziziphus jujuba TaxID=326968 RepID=A0ABM3IFC3_ZIZJJ|nr:uncharacterized protein LOC125421765 [Ziziphus jujuba]XP_048327186.1 probable splicing factor, arginine/serine-rich 6 [Ziziphus jujuba var. spinosa]